MERSVRFRAAVPLYLGVVLARAGVHRLMQPRTEGPRVAIVCCRRGPWRRMVAGLGHVQPITHRPMRSNLQRVDGGAVCRYDKYAFDRMYQSAVGASAARGSLAQLTFLRMGNQFLDNWDAFNAFMARMRGDSNAA